MKIVFDQEILKTEKSLQHLQAVTPAFAKALCGEGKDGLGTWQLSLGPAASGTPLHRHSAAWNKLFFGRKRWIMSPPGSAADMGIGDGYSSEGEISRKEHVGEWLREQYPAHKQAGRLVECVQEKGDMIFVPHSWAHATLNLEPSLAVAQEFCLCALSQCGATRSLGAKYAGDNPQLLQLAEAQKKLGEATREAFANGIAE